MEFDLSSINPFMLFISGVLLLYYSSETIINNSILISAKYNISKLLIGIFILAVGTSLPELFVSIIAILKESPSIVLGNIIGSNIANIGFVFGLTVLIYPISSNPNKNLYYNSAYLFLASILFVFFLNNGSLIRIEGILLVLLCIVYLFFLIFKFNEIDDDKVHENNKINLVKTILMLLLGFVFIYFGSEFFVEGALGISKSLGVEDLAIGMTIVSLGTSAPELFTSIIAIRNKEKNLVIGNLIGSNIFNILLIGGIASIIKNIYIEFSVLLVGCLFLIFIALLFIISILVFKKINRLIGVIFIVIYLFFLNVNF